MAFDNSKNTSLSHLPPADESHRREARPGEAHSRLTPPRRARDAGQRRARQRGPGLGSWEPRCRSQGLPWAPATAGVPVSRSLLGGLLGTGALFLRPRYLSSGEPGHCPSLPPVQCEVAARISTRNAQTKSTIVCKPRQGLLRFPGAERRLRSRGRRYYRDPSPNPVSRAPPLPEQRGRAAQRGPSWRSWGDTRLGLPARTWKGSAAPPPSPPRAARAGPGLTRGARQIGRAHV